MIGSLGSQAIGLNEESRIVCAFRDSYEELMQAKHPLTPTSTLIFRERYGLRDFYHLGRFFSRHKKIPDDSHNVLSALERNFNGMTEEEFRVVVRTFCHHYVRSDEVPRPDDELRDLVAKTIEGLQFRTIVEVLRDSLADVKVEANMLNDTIVRYQLILDTSSDDSAARLMFQCGLLQRGPTETIDLSAFPDDVNDVFRSKVISRIKFCMNQEMTLFLMHTAPIHGSLYDLLNQHFSRVPLSETEVAYYANVAVGSYSRPCPVNPKFRLINHLPNSQTAPPPFYNRFEKYLIGVSVIWHDFVNSKLLETERAALTEVRAVAVSH